MDKRTKEQDIQEERYKNVPTNTDTKPWAEIGLDGGELATGVLTEPLGDDWSTILKSFGLDPTVFEVVYFKTFEDLIYINFCFILFY